MEESRDIYDVYDSNTSPSWEEHQSEHLENLEEVEALRRKIKYYFMNPCEKYHARGRKPWKLLLQIIKIGIITIQVRQLVQDGSFYVSIATLVMFFCCGFFSSP